MRGRSQPLRGHGAPAMDDGRGRVLAALLLWLISPEMLALALTGLWGTCRARDSRAGRDTTASVSSRSRRSRPLYRPKAPVTDLRSLVRVAVAEVGSRPVRWSEIAGRRRACLAAGQVRVGPGPHLHGRPVPRQQRPGQGPSAGPGRWPVRTGVRPLARRSAAAVPREDQARRAGSVPRLRQRPATRCPTPCRSSTPFTW